jgi:hypothetical protein
VISFLFHAFFTTGLAYLLSWIFGSLTPAIAVVSLVIGFWMGRRRARSFLRVFPDLNFMTFAQGDSGALEVILTCLILYVCARHFAWLFFEIDSKLMTLHANNFGDLPLHINYIREIANGVSFPPVNPSFASETLRYPFGPDLYNALWEICGVPLSSHLFLVGLACSVATVTVLKWFGGWWAIGAFFLSGGLAGWSLLSGQPITGDLLQGVDWKNLFLSVFITQRGVLFALPAGLLLIEATRRLFLREVKPTKAVLTTLGLLWGLLPLFHVHAFVIVSLIMGLTAMNTTNSFLGLKQLLVSRLAKVAYLPAIYFVLRSSDMLKKSSILHWDPWWTSSFNEAPQFLIQNFGPWLLLPIAIAIGLWRSKRFTVEKRRALVSEFAIYSGLFVIFFNVMLAPWAWDNIKVLIFPYLGFARLAWVVLDPVLPVFTKYVVAFTLFFSGFMAVELSLAPPLSRGVTIYNMPAIGSFAAALSEVPKEAVFAAAPTHDHALTYFGRIRAVGYEGHLWSHGIDYRKKMDQLNQLMRAGPATDIAARARDLGVTHIVWGPAETAFFTTEPLWPPNFKNVSRAIGIAIYEVPK